MSVLIYIFGVLVGLIVLAVVLLLIAAFLYAVFKKDGDGLRGGNCNIFYRDR